MRHQDIYMRIFEKVKEMLIRKYEVEGCPDDSAFEHACADALTEAARGFDVDVRHLGKRKFPDVKLEYQPDGERIGVEIKLHTSGESWTTLGNSTYASTQEPGLETIFLLFGNFEQHPPAFVIKPYAACIKDITPTHYPRYIIDMGGTTDFCEEQIGVSFDQLRSMSETDRITYVNTYIAKTKYEELTAAAEKIDWWRRAFCSFQNSFRIIHRFDIGA